MNKFLEFWKRDRRYVTLIKAVLLALLPVLCSAVRCAVDKEASGMFICRRVSGTTSCFISSRWKG